MEQGVAEAFSPRKYLWGGYVRSPIFHKVMAPHALLLQRMALRTINSVPMQAAMIALSGLPAAFMSWRLHCSLVRNAKN